MRKIFNLRIENRFPLLSRDLFTGVRATGQSPLRLSLDEGTSQDREFETHPYAAFFGENYSVCFTDF